MIQQCTVSWYVSISGEPNVTCRWLTLYWSLVENFHGLHLNSSTQNAEQLWLGRVTQAVSIAHAKSSIRLIYGIFKVSPFWYSAVVPSLHCANLLHVSLQHKPQSHQWHM